MDWNEVTNRAEIKHLLETFGFFHDSCLKELYMWTESYVNDDLSMNVPPHLDTNVRILFQRQAEDPSAVELLFEGVTQCHILPSLKDHDSVIYGATLISQNNQFYWADASDWETGDYSASWISAECLKWRNASDWMGKENRYGAME
ncbi:hypothetical protein [Sporosarcina sp.]|uniref:hypothetical protein n=1 Tax=Sporosarcina sp. TaxID=49982 RepID=UPI002606BC5C|nr:hypothetical protein [Sporosarcina sp.]